MRRRSYSIYSIPAFRIISLSLGPTIAEDNIASNGIEAMLSSAIVGPSEREIIRNAGIEYIEYDRRRISWDEMIGLFFFNQKSSPGYELVELETYEKFDGLKHVNRILD